MSLCVVCVNVKPLVMTIIFLPCLEMVQELSFKIPVAMAAASMSQLAF